MSEKPSATLMTSGPIWRRLVAFAIPLFWGNLFQQLYNTADSVIVGNFLGNNALAAVSSSGNLIFLLVGFFNGIAIGAGVVTGRYFGAGDRGNLERSVYTTVSFGLVCGVILTAVGIVAAAGGGAAGVAGLFPGLLCRVPRFCHVQLLCGDPAGYGGQPASAHLSCHFFGDKYCA